MGTGITSILIHQLPYNAQWLIYVSYCFFVLNIVLFITFLTLTLLRYLMYWDIWEAMITHPAQSMFVGTFPMGFASKLSNLQSHFERRFLAQEPLTYNQPSST